MEKVVLLYDDTVRGGGKAYQQAREFEEVDCVGVTPPSRFRLPCLLRGGAIYQGEDQVLEFLGRLRASKEKQTKE